MLFIISDTKILNGKDSDKYRVFFVVICLALDGVGWFIFLYSQ